MLTIRTLKLIYTKACWGFYASLQRSDVFRPTRTIGGEITGDHLIQATNIYLAPTSLSAITFNFLMSRVWRY